jgi:hypothetical protein
MVRGARRTVSDYPQNCRLPNAPGLLAYRQLRIVFHQETKGTSWNSPIFTN